MEKIKIGALAAAAGICLLLAIAAGLVYVTPPMWRYSGRVSAESALTLCVLEGYTESPIENATVVILKQAKHIRPMKRLNGRH